MLGKKLILFLTVVLFLSTNTVFATVYYICGTGVVWNASNQILYPDMACAGSPVKPNTLTSSDEIIILSGAQVTVYGSQSTNAIKLTISGTLFTKSGATPGKLTLSDNSATLVLAVGSVLGCSSDGTTQSSCSPASSSQIIIGSGANKYTYKGSDLDVINGLPKPSVLDNTGGPLPVELILFCGQVANDIVELQWTTASEENFDCFSIERSADGYNFKEIARIQGIGNSTERVDYEYTDEFPINGRSYYRLRSIDFDGYTEVFDYVMVEVAGVAANFTVFPNPIADGYFTVQTNFVGDQGCELIIYNNMGRVEATYKFKDWRQQFENHNLERGNYLFKLITPDVVLVKRVSFR